MATLQGVGSGRRYLGVILAALFAISGCATQVDRVAPDKTVDLSGYWNDTDSRLVSQEMVEDALSRPWIGHFERRHHSAVPVVIVGEIRNLSYEHIDTHAFTEDIERALINSGKVDFVASSGQRGQIRDERRDQDLNASSATRKAMGQEIGADYMMKGTINMIIDSSSSGSTQVRYYQVDLDLISLADNRIVWIGQKKIKKIVHRHSLRF